MEAVDAEKWLPREYKTITTTSSNNNNSLVRSKTSSSRFTRANSIHRSSNAISKSSQNSPESKNDHNNLRLTL